MGGKTTIGVGKALWRLASSGNTWDGDTEGLREGNTQCFVNSTGKPEEEGDSSLPGTKFPQLLQHLHKSRHNSRIKFRHKFRLCFPHNFRLNFPHNARLNFLHPRLDFPHNSRLNFWHNSRLDFSNNSLLDFWHNSRLYFLHNYKVNFLTTPG